MSRASRRRFLIGAAAGTAGLAVPRILQAQAPAVVTAERHRPLLPSGIMAGDIDGDRAVIWSRSDRPAQMLVEWSTTEAFRDVHRVTGEVALPESDHTARVELAGLPHGQTIFYRVQFQDVGDAAVRSEALTGRIVVPAREERRDVTFVFSGDEAGQGWGINPERGGYRIYEAMRRQQPDFFIHSGDQIYADGPLQAEVKLDDGTIWKNVVTEAKSKVCETVADFRGAFAYNLMDENKRRFAAEVPFLVQWDDHEVRNNWFPGQTIGDQRYQQRDASLLAARARRAMFDFNPIRRDPFDPERLYRSFAFGPGLDVFMLDERSYRGPNTPNREEGGAAFLGADQIDWLKTRLKRSRATWKVIASDMPISIVVPDGNPDVEKGTFEAWANGEPGKPLGRELELALLLKFIRDNDIRNVVWVTADVHYPSATYYDPAKAAGFAEFKPFWEIVAGPLNAGTFGPGAIDPTFGPDVRFVGIPEGMKQNRSPADGLQFFGRGRLDARTNVLTMSLHDIDGREVWSTALTPEA